jgi:hypothetical protein
MTAQRASSDLRDLCLQLWQHPVRAKLPGESPVQRALDVVETETGFELLAVLRCGVSPDTPLTPVALSRQGGDDTFLQNDLDYIRGNVDAVRGITNWVRDTGSIAQVGDVMVDPRYFGMRDDIRSELCVPLRVGENVIGVVNTETPNVGYYTARDSLLLEELSRLIAVVMSLSSDHVSAHADFMVVCSYCGHLKLADGWMELPFDVRQDQSRLISHGCCPTCFDLEMSRLR